MPSATMKRPKGWSRPPSLRIPSRAKMLSWLGSLARLTPGSVSPAERGVRVESGRDAAGRARGGGHARGGQLVYRGAPAGASGAGGRAAGGRSPRRAGASLHQRHRARGLFDHIVQRHIRRAASPASPHPLATARGPRRAARAAGG